MSEAILRDPTLSEGLLRAGRLLFSRYRLRRMLGKGGMGVVWLADDTKLDRPVALKFLSDLLLSDAASRDDLKRETRRSLDLTHPNIVRIHDFVEDEEAAAISLEFVDGKTLSQLRVERPQRCFEAEGLICWVGGLCSALEYAHRDACVVHRDLKPSNLMVAANGTLKVADFGISCGLQNTAARVSAWSCSGGTLGYMSPQQLRGELASPADDIYSIGATLYELLTSKPPFYAGDVSLQIREAQPAPLAERRRQLGVAGEPIPEVWSEVLAACLEKKPEDRPRSAGEIARRLGIDARRTEPSPDLELTMRDPIATAVAPHRSGDVGEFAKFCERSLAEAASRWRRLPTARRRSLARTTVGLAAVVLTAAFWPRHAAPRPVASAPAPSAMHAPAMPAAASVLAAATASPVGPPGGMMVKTLPSGAVLRVEGAPEQSTPASVSGLSPGAHAVTVELDGFEPQSVQAQVRSGEFTDLGVLTLVRSTGAMHLTTDPQNVAYSLFAADSAAAIRHGQTPENIEGLPTGNYRVRLEREGWPVAEETVAVERRAVRVVSHRFGSGEVKITSDPPGAMVSLGGRVLGKTPLAATLPSGHQAFTAVLQGYGETAFAAEVAPDATVEVPPLLLQPEPPRLKVESDPPGLDFQLFAGAVESPNAEPVRAGETPVEFADLPPGIYRLIYSAPPWPLRSAAVEVAAHGLTVAHESFARGTVRLESDPPGAEIFAGEVSLGTTPCEAPLPPGRYELTAELNGQSAHPRTVALSAETVQTMRFDFRTGTTRTTHVHHRKPPKKAPDTALDKIGRTLNKFFTGKPQASARPN